MKKVLNKELKTTIKFNISRFISIIVIIFLGVSFFIGMTTNSEVLSTAMNTYLEEYNYSDIQVYSYLGLTREDIKKIKNKVTEIEEVEPKYYVEAQTTIKDIDGRNTEYPIYVQSYKKDYNINKLKVIEGRNIENDGECVISVELANTGKKIGDTIKFSNNNLKNQKYKIVGTVEDPQYIINDKGLKAIQGNLIKYTAYINEKEFTYINDSFYTFDIRVKNKYKKFTEKYDNYLEIIKERIKKESDEILQKQLDEFILEKTKELETAEQDYLKMKLKTEDEIKSAENAINEGERQIRNMELLLLPDSKVNQYKETLGANVETARRAVEANDNAIRIANNLSGISETLASNMTNSQGLECIPDPDHPSRFAREALMDSRNGYYESYYRSGSIYYGEGEYIYFDSDDYTNYWQGLTDEDDKEECWRRERLITSMREQLYPVLQVEDMVREYQYRIDNMYDQYNDFDCTQVGVPEITNICNRSKNQLKDRINEQEDILHDLNEEVDYIHDKIENTRTISEISEIVDHYISKTTSLQDKTRKAYNDAQKNYNSLNAQINSATRNTRKEINEAEEKINEAKAQLEKRKKIISNQLEIPYKEIIENRKLLRNAQKQPWIINTRNDSFGYSNFKDDIARLENLSKIIPLLFFIIASLITATSISRLVEEERRKIGILKSLGATKLQIISKYTNYAFFATIIGLVLGVLLGTFFYPTLAKKIYSVAYYIPEITYKLHLKQIIIVLVISLFSTVVVAYVSAHSVAKEKPAVLLRYKEIKTTPLINLVGRKGILNRLSNTRKLVYRNITTSPIRSIMTIVGMLGCTALIIASFSVRQSIRRFTEIQYNKIYKVDAEFYYKSQLMQSDIRDDYKEVINIDDVNSAFIGRKETLKMKNNQSIEAYGITPDATDKFERIVNLNSVITNEKVSLKNRTGVIITEKLAKLLNIKKGDKISFIDSSNIEHTIKVNDIVENYLYNYIYMNKETYEKLYNYEMQNNFMAIQYKEDVNVELLNSEMYNRNNYSNIIPTSFYLRQIENIIRSLDIIIIVIIISAGLLAFSVIYNISKINLDEKTVEIATFKVLGYKNKWISNYLKIEIRILEIVGMFFGLFGGYLLSESVITACEGKHVMFSHEIMPSSYIYGILLTIVFILLMNIVIYKNVKKVSMSQALKVQEE